MKIKTMAEVKADYGLKGTDLVTVCASCLRASCWQGEFYCENYKAANIARLPVKTLLRMNREDPHHWKAENPRKDATPNFVRKQ